MQYAPKSMQPGYSAARKISDIFVRILIFIVHVFLADKYRCNKQLFKDVFQAKLKNFRAQRIRSERIPPDP